MSIKNKPRSRRSNLAFTISAALAATALCGVDQVLAQDNAALEEVVVTGIRGSLERSMDIKRDSAGVVDAISAEDIGKFPDTNLAESLQRISGVSIDRANGEGALITVRGFQGENNMVTLNGRQMPAGRTYGGGSGAGGTFGGGTRAFDFSNLASEAVSGVEVYKTGRASISSGGIGASVNITTMRPLDNPGTQAVLGLKAMHDTTVGENGKHWTPEYSGLISWTDDTEVFGIGLTFSKAQRHSGFAGGHANNWNIAEWDASDTVDDVDRSYNGYSLLPGMTPEEVVTNAPDDGQLFARPNDFRWTYSEIKRDRLNAQFVMQLAPIDNLVMTLDYTYAEQDIWEHRGEWTMWLHNSSTVDTLVFDDSPVPTPVYIHETTFNKDIGYEQQLRQQNNTMDSLGFNADWDVTDNFNLALDMHASTMESLPSGPGGVGEMAISLGAPVANVFEYWFDGEMPVGNIGIDDSSTGNDNDIFDEGDIGSAQGRLWYNSSRQDVTQVKLDAGLETGIGQFDFGIDIRSVEMNNQASNRAKVLGNWGVENPGEFSRGSIDMNFPMAAQYDDYDMSRGFQGGARAYDVADLCDQTVDLYDYPGDATQWMCRKDDVLSTDDTIEEDISAFYIEWGMEGELGSMGYDILVGVRYEETDLTSTSLVRLPLFLVWQDNNDFQETRYAGPTPQSYSVESSYDNTLPSVDFGLDITENLKTRFSYSTTIARADYGNLNVSAGGYNQNNPTYLGAQPTANRSAPELLPLESDNIDLSLEWYYGDASYASIGYFQKKVNNFIGTGQQLETIYGMRDPSNGPRVIAAAAELESMGIAIDATSLFAMTALMDNIDDFPGGTADFQTAGSVVDPAWAIFMANTYDIDAIFSGPNADPETVWLTSVPQNNKEATIDGVELAVQHFFGDTGFGISANYTIVDGDIGFNDLAPTDETQFALLGLSDTANVVFIYEKHNLEARLAWNWRDDFLRQTNQGSSNNPVYVQEYEQWDLSVFYNVTDQFGLFLEGLNLTEENTRWYQRSFNHTRYVEDLGARYAVGARFTF